MIRWHHRACATSDEPRCRYCSEAHGRTLCSERATISIQRERQRPLHDVEYVVVLLSAQVVTVEVHSVNSSGSLVDIGIDGSASLGETKAANLFRLPAQIHSALSA